MPVAVTTVVTARHIEAEDVAVVELRDPDGWVLPPFAAGAHLDVMLPGGLMRPYSLCGDPAEGDRYRIAVRRRAGGGSAALHEHLDIGAVVPVSLPRNLFPLASEASRHVLIAGGIGITPFMSMVPVLQRAGAVFHLHACAPALAVLPFRRTVEDLVAAGRATLHVSGGDPANRLDLGRLLAEPETGTHIYCCGPSGMLEAFDRAAAAWPAGHRHAEHFTPAAPKLPQTGSFTVVLARSNRRVSVAPGRSIARSLFEAGIIVPVSCESGTCGTCRVRYLAGKPIHRDLVLRQEERASYLMPCVASSAEDELVLDL